MLWKTAAACCLVAFAALTAPERARVDVAAEIANSALDEWLGPSRWPAPAATFARPIWSSAASMDLESQAVFPIARARFGALDTTPDTRTLADALAWHLQSRIVEDVFDRVQQRPGHHVVTLPMFGGHVQWSIPALAVSRLARDERAEPSIERLAAVVATLDNIVGWPSLAAALRQIAESPQTMDSSAAQRLLESALGVPLDWFFGALAAGVHVDYALTGVTVQQDDCNGQRCFRTTAQLSRSGPPLFSGASRGPAGVPIEFDFGNGVTSTVLWRGDESTQAITVESGIAPAGVRVDPQRTIVVDDDWHDQRWRAEPAPVSRPIKSMAAWIVWLQNAALTCGVLL